MKTGLLLLAAILLSGCTASVYTYNADGKLLGSCEATRLIWGPVSECNGSANPKDQTAKGEIIGTPRNAERKDAVVSPMP